jgi:adenosyl cobinamide kinase/adenosyl cobinamide phosphate guanylyltransferase
VAERLALRARSDASAGSSPDRPDAGPVLYLATGWADPGDDDMATRIERHRARRGPEFALLEVAAELPGALREHGNRPALVDGLGTWVARFPDFAAPADDLVDALRARSAPTVVVSDEVGLGVHPETEVGRRFRDALGLLNQLVAAAADRSYLVVAGRAVELGPPP